VRPDDLIRRAFELFPGSRLLPALYCEECGEQPGRYSNTFGVVLCDACWRPRFYEQRLPWNR
jgi:hypothetical protein